MQKIYFRFNPGFGFTYSFIGFVYLSVMIALLNAYLWEEKTEKCLCS